MACYCSFQHIDVPVTLRLFGQHHWLVCVFSEFIKFFARWVSFFWLLRTKFVDCAWMVAHLLWEIKSSVFLFSSFPVMNAAIWIQLSSSSPDSSEEEINRKVKVYKDRHWGSDENFHKLYRFTRQNVEFLANHFLDGDETRGGALSRNDRMRVCLRYMSDPGFQNGVEEDIGVHQSTVCKVVWEVAAKIVQKSNDWIRFPSTENEFEAAAAKWRKKYRFPNALGAIDCTLLHISKPSQHGDEYVCL